MGKETRREVERDRLIDAHFANQIRQKTIRTPNAVVFRGPALQYGSGKLGAFAMRMNRVAMPLVKKHVIPVAKESGKNVLSPFVPEISNVISGRKRPKTVLGKTLKKSSSKTIASTTSASSKNVITRAYTSKKQLEVYPRLCDRLARRHGRRGTEREGGGRAGEWRAMEPAGAGRVAGRRLCGEHETIK